MDIRGYKTALLQSFLYYNKAERSVKKKRRMKITKRWGARCRASQKGYPSSFSTKALPATGFMAFPKQQE
jgi:hypothetical protein